MGASTTRERILDAADALFGEVGFESATTRRIAELSGVNKALIHYHFKSKDDLLLSLLGRYYDALGERLREALSPGETLRDRLLAVLDAYVDFLATHRTFSSVVQREAAAGRHVAEITALMKPLFEQGCALVRGALPATRGGDLDAAHLLVSFYGMTVAYFTYSPLLAELLGHDPLSPAGLAARKRHLGRMVDLVVDALGPPARPNGSP